MHADGKSCGRLGDPRVLAAGGRGDVLTAAGAGAALGQGQLAGVSYAGTQERRKVSTEPTSPFMALTRQTVICRDHKAAMRMSMAWLLAPCSCSC